MSNFFSGDSGRSTTTQTVDPSQQRLNDLYFGEALGLKNASGGAAAFGTPQPGLYGLQPSEDFFRRAIMGFTGGAGGVAGGVPSGSSTSPDAWAQFLTKNAIAPDSGLDVALRGNPAQAANYGWRGPSSTPPAPPAGGADPYAQVLQKMFSQANRSSDYAGEAMDWSRQSPTGQVDLEALNSIRALLGRSLEGPNELESGALRSWSSRTDPNEMLSAAERYMNLIGGPEAKATSVAGGMGGVRGGAFQEGLARESARLALPILQLINQNVGEFGAAQERTSGALEGRRRGLSGDLFQMGGNIEGRGLARRGFAGQEGARASTAMGNLGQLMPLIDQNRLAMLTAGQQAAAMPRMLALQDFLRQQDVTMSTLLRTPTRTGGTTSATTNEDFTLKSILGPAALFAALMMRPGAK